MQETTFPVVLLYDKITKDRRYQRVYIDTKEFT